MKIKSSAGNSLEDLPKENIFKDMLHKTVPM
jgi:hypothetical protein